MDSIAFIFVDFYHNLLDKKNIEKDVLSSEVVKRRPLVTDFERMMLKALVTTLEVKSVL